MYGIDKTQNYDFLLEFELEQIIFTKNVITLIFSNEALIDIESNFEFCSQKINFLDKDFSNMNAAGKLLNLLGKRIVAIEAQTEFLEITFEKENVLNLYDCNAPYYESFSIRHADIFIVV